MNFLFVSLLVCYYKVGKEKWDKNKPVWTRSEGISGFPSIEKMREGDTPFKKIWLLKLDNHCFPLSPFFPPFFPSMKRKSIDFLFWSTLIISIPVNQTYLWLFSGMWCRLAHIHAMKLSHYPKGVCVHATCRERSLWIVWNCSSWQKPGVCQGLF